MWTDDDEPQWTIAFLAWLCTFLGTFPLLAGLWSCLILPVDFGDPAYVRGKSELVLTVEGIAGAFLLIASGLNLWGSRNQGAIIPANRFMSNVPLLSLYPHPLRWILGFELLLWILLVVSNGLTVLQNLPQ
jgi:hypothetical protein